MRFTVLSLILLINSRCGYNNTSLSGSTLGGDSANNGNQTESVDFATVKSQVLRPNCLSCHSAGGGNQAGVNLETYANVTTNLRAIDSSVKSGFMPRNSTLSVGAKAMLLNWIAAGAPEFSTLPTDHNPRLEPGIVSIDEEHVFDSTTNEFLTKSHPSDQINQRSL